MKNRILLFISLITLVLTVFFVYRQSVENEEKKLSVKIGVSIYDEYDTFIALMSNYISEFAKQAEREFGVAVTIDIISANGSQLTQNDQLDEFINNEYDCICINLVDRTDAAVIIEKARNANVPIVFFNRELVNEDLKIWDKLIYVGAIAKEAGNLQGQIIIDACEKRFDEIDMNKDGVLQYVILEGEAGHQDSLMRTEGALSTLVEYGYEIEKLESEFANWDRAQAKTKVIALLDKYVQSLEVIIANNDDMALGAIDALKTRNPHEWPLIVGVNGSEEAIEMVRSKKMEGTVYNDAKGQANAIVRIATAFALDEDIPEDLIIVDEKYVYLPYQIIDYSNAQQFSVK